MATNSPIRVPIDLAGVASNKESVRDCLNEAKSVLIEMVNETKTLDSIRQQSTSDLREKYGLDK